MATWDDATREMQRLIEEAARQAAKEIAVDGASLAKRFTQDSVDAAGHRGRVDRGAFVQAIFGTEPTRTSAGWQAAVTVPPVEAEKSNVIEEGRRPGSRMPPLEPIRGWVARKLGEQVASRLPGARSSLRAARPGGRPPRVTGVRAAVRETALERTAYLVARKIARRGTPGIQPFLKAAQALGAGRAAARAEAVFRRVLGPSGGAAGAVPAGRR